MSDQGELYEKCWLLYHILDRSIGSRETVVVRRRTVVVAEQLQNARGSIREFFLTGSRAEGFIFLGSENDWMFIDKNAVVLCRDQDISNQLDTANKLVLMMRKANSRPGYVNLELLHQVHVDDPSIVKVCDSQFFSSEEYKRIHTKITRGIFHLETEVHGPAVKIKHEYSDKSSEVDIVFSIPCYDWPSEANEWMNRTRLHDWPDTKLRDQIVQGGCHLVPVGDKTSAADQSLQWRISFVTAERKLFHSLTHVQFLVYGLLKKFLKQISGTLEQMYGEADILSSYIIKTSILYAVEGTSASFWQEKHTFLCFMFCLKILINWVKAGHCPNYFIKKNNMFLGKVHGQNQQKLLRYLTDLHDMNWNCLSVGTGIQTTIGERIRSVRNGVWDYVLPPSTHSERERDEASLSSGVIRFINSSPDIISSLELLSASKSDIDEFMGYCATGQSLSCKGMKIFGEHINARGNKEKYKSLRKCKNLLRPFSTMFTSPGLLGLATYYYKTGNYMKTLEMCDHMTSSFKMYLDGIIECREDWDKYVQIYCERGYNLLHKCQAFVTDMTFNPHTLQFCPSQLQQVITIKREIIPPHQLQSCPPQVQQVLKYVCDKIPFFVPPLPYAVFLSFLCYHEMGDTRRRDRALIDLRTVKYDVRQGAGVHWIVHNILGICYETVGDTHRALREYMESLGVPSITQYQNPARELIARLQHEH